MKNVPFLVLLIILFVCKSLAAAQAFQQPEIEYAPNLIELKGKSRVYVYSEDLSARARIVKELLRYGRLSIAERVEDSDFIIAWGGNVLTDGAPQVYEDAGSGAKMTIVKEMTALRYVLLEDGRQRQRIIWHLRATKTVYSIPVPLRIAPNKAFSSAPRSAKGASVELGIRLLFFWLSKKRPQFFAFDQFENQASISFGRDPEVQAAREFVKALRQVDEANEVPGRPASPTGIFLRPAEAPELDYHRPRPLPAEPSKHMRRCRQCPGRPRRAKQ